MSGHRLPENVLRDLEFRLKAGQVNNDIANAVKVDPTTVRKYRKRFKNTGTVFPLIKAPPGRDPLLDDLKLQELELLVLARPDLYQEEMQYYFLDYWDFWPSQPTISRSLAALKLSRKVQERRAGQRNESLRAEWARWVWLQPVEYLVFVDESACSEKSLDRKYGYSPRGMPSADRRHIRRTERFSLLPAYDINGFLDGPLIIKAAVDGEMFKNWLQESVIPQMNPYPGPRSVLVMDNCQTHRVAVS
jgi:transposase